MIAQPFVWCFDYVNYTKHFSSGRIKNKIAFQSYLMKSLTFMVAQL